MLHPNPERLQAERDYVGSDREKLEALITEAENAAVAMCQREICELREQLEAWRRKCLLCEERDALADALEKGVGAYVLPEERDGITMGDYTALIAHAPEAAKDAALGREVRAMPEHSRLEHNEQGTTYEVDPEGEDGGGDYTDAEWAYETPELMLCGMTVDDVIGGAALAALRESEGEDA
jgi:hypothetical protein